MRKFIHAFLLLLAPLALARPIVAQAPTVTPLDAGPKAAPAAAETKPIIEANYRLYDAKGNPATLEQIISAAGKADVVFLGENHDDAVAHHLQMEIFRRTAEANKNRKVALSLEMFERDVQPVVDEYLQDLISETHFLLSSRPWKNYKTDYRPLVEYAKQNRLSVIAANAPRRYVNMVSRNGRDALNALSPTAKSWLAPLPYGEPSPAYATKFTAQMSQGGGGGQSGHDTGKMLQSQGLWDATMAYSIAEYLKKEDTALIVHLNGYFHTESRLGTAEQLLKYAPDSKILVVTIRREDNFETFDKAQFENTGDFVILTDARIPRSSQQ